MSNITCGICLVPAWRGALVGCRESLLFTLSEAYTAVPLDRGALKGFSLCNRVRVTKLKTARTKLSYLRHTTVRDSDYCSRHAGASGQVRIILVWYLIWRYELIGISSHVHTTGLSGRA